MWYQKNLINDKACFELTLIWTNVLGKLKEQNRNMCKVSQKNRTGIVSTWAPKVLKIMRLHYASNLRVYCSLTYQKWTFQGLQINWKKTVLGYYILWVPIYANLRETTKSNKKLFNLFLWCGFKYLSVCSEKKKYTYYTRRYPQIEKAPRFVKKIFEFLQSEKSTVK